MSLNCLDWSQYLFLAGLWLSMSLIGRQTGRQGKSLVQKAIWSTQRNPVSKLQTKPKLKLSPILATILLPSKVCIVYPLPHSDLTDVSPVEVRGQFVEVSFHLGPGD